jgi:hypothetical protein
LAGYVFYILNGKFMASKPTGQAQSQRLMKPFSTIKNSFSPLPTTPEENPSCPPSINP